jgi:hypothetical protein
MKAHLKWQALIRISLLVLCVISSLGTASGQTSSTIWFATSLSAVADAGPDSAVEVGVKFRADVSGFVTGIRFYKSSENTGTHVGNLWTRHREQDGQRHVYR